MVSSLQRDVLRTYEVVINASNNTTIACSSHVQKVPIGGMLSDATQKLERQLAKRILLVILVSHDGKLS